VSPTDAELAQQALAGSQSAYHALVTRYAVPAVNLAARVVGDRTLAEDLAQEAFIRAFDRLATYDTDRKFSSWFFQIVHNVTVDHVRRRRIDTVSLDHLDSPHHAQRFAAATGPQPDDQAEQAALNRDLDRALAGIRPDYREVIVLRYREGLSDREIAGVTGLPVGTVKTYLHRARKELAAVLSARGWAPDTEVKPSTSPFRRVTEDT
jgi:RNA polymerase sigma-70 factor (ECF subfamily)